MKNKILIIVLGTMLFVACKKENAEKNSTIIPENNVADVKLANECYQAITGKDTISLTVDRTETEKISGQLSYKFFEKDRSEGTIKGVIMGDTLLADYTFKSEGVLSVRQVVFLKKGNGYTEGYGSIIEKNGNTKFQSDQNLKFDGKIILSKIDCME